MIAAEAVAKQSGLLLRLPAIKQPEDIAVDDSDQIVSGLLCHFIQALLYALSQVLYCGRTGAAQGSEA
jgi:hypothetical protein